MKHPWTIIRGKSPLIATAIHNGHDIREELTELHAIDEETRQREEDFYTGEWTTVADTRVILHQSRFEVDMNRTHEKAVYIKPSDAWGLQIWKVKPPIDVINRSLELYNSFYNELFHLLSDTIKQCGRFVLLDIHSYRHRRESPDAEFDPIANNPEVIVGTGNMDRSFWTPVVDTFIMDLRKFNFMGRNLDVRENVKFPGGHFSRWVHNTFFG